MPQSKKGASECTFQKTCGTSNSGSGLVPDTFTCSWDPFPPTVFPHSDLIGSFVTSPSAYFRLGGGCYKVLFDMKTGSSLKGSRKRTDPSDMHDGENERTGGRGNCSWDVRYKRRSYFK